MRNDAYTKIAERYDVPGSDEEAVERFFLEVAPALSRAEREAIVAELQCDDWTPDPAAGAIDLPAEVPTFRADDAPPISTPGALAQLIGQLSAAVETRVRPRLESIERTLDALQAEVADLRPERSGRIGTLVEGHAPVHAAPDETVRQAVRRMVEANVGAVAVLDDEKLVGIFSQGDLLRRVIGDARDPDRTSVASVMTKEIVVADPQDDIAHLVELMQRVRCSHLPVVDRGKLVGMFSLSDLIAAAKGSSGSSAETVDSDTLSKMR